MEHTHGVRLDVLLRRGPLECTEVARLGAELARGLAAAHAAGVVHGDITPAKLKITSDGELKILDFPARANTGEDAGDARTADIFAAGAVLYQMACGRAPFSASNPEAAVRAILNGKVPLPSQVHRGVHRALERIIIRALEPIPARRYASANDLARALEALEMTRGCRESAHAEPSHNLATPDSSIR
jgi:serine/threonine-protein kinase